MRTCNPEPSGKSDDPKERNVDVGYGICVGYAVLVARPVAVDTQKVMKYALIRLDEVLRGGGNSRVRSSRPILERSSERILWTNNW